MSSENQNRKDDLNIEHSTDTLAQQLAKLSMAGTASKEELNKLVLKIE